ncbi:MAG: sulfurtransferase TusA family protein [Nitrospinaceae bacterium]|jgi:TusA-related sulfurtransferase|nr:sulfurtransferase TusA family protein [Nitrospinaceae bacterium]MBT3433501.1 sulfurtransferase TusA family protein [Nitrospinaceae bacterium]MBT3820125.1 sulfurtransferase TusA family protein [Nitrospinaceae bacterium]MBT4095714.1 sulfurtransferase TusA family protein [Nitrospinaceae bacterium]MBT4429903.1 sulfurtransferase TusA family protein [Nitrospinaceae bacterium]
MPDPKIIDLKGEICPDPLIQVQAAMKNNSVGDIYIVIVDYPLAVENIARWAENEGMDVEVTHNEGEWEISITVT